MRSVYTDWGLMCWAYLFPERTHTFRLIGDGPFEVLQQDLEPVLSWPQLESADDGVA